MRGFRRSASIGSKLRLAENTRRCAVFATSPIFRRGESALFSLQEVDQREQGFEYITLVTLDLFHLDFNRSTPSCSSNQTKPYQTIPNQTKPNQTKRSNNQPNNNVVLSIPKGRDQADPGRMLVSLHHLSSSRHLRLTMSPSFIRWRLSGAEPSVAPSPAQRPVRAPANAPARDAPTGRPRPSIPTPRRDARESRLLLYSHLSA